ncbi:DUF1566 domain-containing protein [Roseateles sp. BYS87W]|uniref:DUF1566 domain-containing protein n=1 Tax=Pelomonas baiyunensis TaxID=3299026 RepID=A0ABW7GVL0_9BURK
MTVLLLAGAGMLGLDLWLSRVESRFQPLTATPWLVLDRQLGLVWQRCPVGTRFSVDAAGTAACTGTPDWLHTRWAEQTAQRLSTPSERWRLPTVRELSSLIDDRRCCHALEPMAFPPFAMPGPEDKNWTGRTYPTHTATPIGEGGERWRVDSLQGEAAPKLVQERAVLRLVRAAAAGEH